MNHSLLELAAVRAEGYRVICSVQCVESSGLFGGRKAVAHLGEYVRRSSSCRLIADELCDITEYSHKHESNIYLMYVEQCRTP